MQKINQVSGVIAPLDRANIDTDAIIPKQFLKSIKRTGFADNLFDEWRYLDLGQPGMDCSQRPRNQDFVLNQATYATAKILLTRQNFGCGSSREHAAWAIKEFGFDVVLAPSFGDIFFNNAFKNALLAISLSEPEIDQLFNLCQRHLGLSAVVDLPNQSIITSTKHHYAFEVDPFRKQCLINGLDDIDLTLQHEQTIKDFEKQHQQRYPWLFRDLG